VTTNPKNPGRPQPKLDVAVLAVSPFAQNCSILKDPETGDAVVVDPGDDLDDVIALAKERGAKLVAIVATHGHVDHVGRSARNLGFRSGGRRRRTASGSSSSPPKG
jgi:hydroxyacylglutathione hydrolase